MNIEALNQLGQQTFLSLISMFWQSSLLIAVIWIVDRALRRKLHAAVRYALWGVMLVKLVTPPSFALPTGVGWWLFSEPPVKSQPSIFIVDQNVGGNVAPATVKSPTISSVPHVAISESVWVLAGCAGVSLALLGWLAFRWRQVAREVRQAAPASEKLEQILEQSRQACGLRAKVQVRLTERLISPSVCGFLRPVILMPRVLVEQLSDEQMRAVLLHELIHVKRGDIWINCAQAALQIAYWWHPFVWLGNVQMRRVREEAVDEGVMLALAESSENYAPTLLKVAKLAFSNPQPSLALIGILESRSDLKRRIERLLSLRPSRKAGLTLLSFLGIAAFTTLAVPMGVAPVAPASTHVNVVPKAAAPELAPTNASKLGVHPVMLMSNTPGMPLIKFEVKFIEVEDSCLNSEPADSPLRGLPLDAITNVTEETRAVAELRRWFEQPERLRLERDGNATVTKILSSEDARLLINRVQQRSGTDILTAPAMTVAAGQNGYFAGNGKVTCVTGVKGELSSNTPPMASFQYYTATLRQGPELSFKTKLEADGSSIALNVQSHVLNFLGYDEAKSISLTPPGRKPLTAVSPFPRFRLVELGAKASVKDGQTLMLAGPVDYSTVTMKDKVPLLGDIPLLGRLFRHESKSQVKKHLILLISPRIVDGAGNPVHAGS